VIELSGYTIDEKIRIAQRYLIPRQTEANGLKPEQIRITKSAISKIITGYTREAGVRNIERELAAVCRGVASQIAEGVIEKAKITARDLHRFLGPVRITEEAAARTAKPGVVMGLAWTPAGGDVLFIEATTMKGKGGLTLTGQLGDVMKESATAALSFIRANAEALGIAKDFLEGMDIHIHVPSGATPKDGPSAGVTMLTALTSLLTNRTVKKDLAMTGEITLRGLVLPIGGVKEKVLAAHRAGVKTIILPKWNKKDLEDVPAKVRKEITFHFVDEMMEVLRIALDKAPESAK
jgi:ATP-dependent Lon protease